MVAQDLYKNIKVSLGYCASTAGMSKEDSICKKRVDASLDWIHVESIKYLQIQYNRDTEHAVFCRNPDSAIITVCNMSDRLGSYTVS